MKNKEQKCLKQCFLICKSMYILKVYSVHYTLRWNTNLKKIPFEQNKWYKKCPLFSFATFTFNLQFLYELKQKVRLSKTVCGIFHFLFHFVFIKKYIFVQRHVWTLWIQNLIIPFKIKIIKKPHTVLQLDLSFLSCNKKI